MPNIRIQKFGGSSLANIDRIEAVADYITGQYAQADTALVAVVSAMGDHTDELLALAHAVSKHPPKREVDMLLSVGERVSMALLSIALHKRGVEAVSFTGSQVGIVTDEEYGSARISHITGLRIKEALSARQVAIVAGFQGVSLQGKNITTLGRGGTDLTAVALGVALGADSVELMKDVPGIFAVPPKIRPHQTHLAEISWKHMKYLADFGAQVIQSRAVQLASKYQLPLIVRSAFDFSLEGTRVGASDKGDHKKMVEMQNNLERSFLTAVTHADDLKLLKLKIKTESSISAMMFSVTRYCKSTDTHPLLLDLGQAGNQQSALMLAISEQHMKPLLLSLQDHVELMGEYSCCCVTAVGGGFLQADQFSQELTSKIPREALHVSLRDDILHVFSNKDHIKELLKHWAELIEMP